LIAPAASLARKSWKAPIPPREPDSTAGYFQRCVKMILDISQLQHHVSSGKSEFVRDKAIAPH
jgi:hypothetical protein